MDIVVGFFGIAACALFVRWAIRVSIRSRRRAQFWNRVEAVIEQPETTLTPEQIAEFHATRWDGD